MKQRLSQGKVLRAARSVGCLIASIHDARVRFTDCRALRPTGLASLAKLLKQLSRLPQASDYTQYEAALKGRVIRALKKMHGHDLRAYSWKHALARKLPAIYHSELDECDKALRYLLKVLADVSVADVKA
jgi:hypothetical protein